MFEAIGIVISAALFLGALVWAIAEGIVRPMCEGYPLICKAMLIKIKE